MQSLSESTGSLKQTNRKRSVASCLCHIRARFDSFRAARRKLGKKAAPLRLGAPQTQHS